MLAGECHLFHSCDSLVPVTGAVTATPHSDCVCSLPVVPSDGELLLSLPPDTELQCVQHCRAVSACTHYLYHQSIAYCKLLDSPDTFSPAPTHEITTGQY